MQSVDSTFTSEAKDSVRDIAQRVLISWKKNYNAAISFFTIGVSTIGSSDLIKGDNDQVGDWDKYDYNDETSRVISIGLDREMPQIWGGMRKTMADVVLDNTSGRFTREVDDDIGTSLVPRRPLKIYTGFKYNGIDNNLMKFVGLTTKPPKVDTRRGIAELYANDFMDYLWNYEAEDSSMYSSSRSDEVIEDLLIDAGFATSQYDLDAGINIISFGIIEKGQKLGNIIQDITEAEGGQFYQDELGILRFENRQHWTVSPHNVVSMPIHTSLVIDKEEPMNDTIYNICEVKSSPLEKKEKQFVWGLQAPISIKANGKEEIWVDYDDPVQYVDTPQADGATSFYVANSQEDGEGTNKTSVVNLKSIDNFQKASKLVFENTSSQPIWLTELNIWARPIQVVKEILVREKDDSSVTAYGEKVLTIENDYIQDEGFARTVARMVVDDFGEPNNRLDLIIKAQPQLQLGDLVSYGGSYYYLYQIQEDLNASVGYIQTLKLIKRVINTYFRIGISTIGGIDKISP